MCVNMLTQALRLSEKKCTCIQNNDHISKATCTLHCTRKFTSKYEDN